MASPTRYSSKLVSAYIPDRFQDYYIPVTESVQPYFMKMGSQILNETPLDENPHPGPRSSCLQVHNVPKRRDVEEIRAFLKDCGTINSCVQGPVQTDDTYVAYVTFDNREEAQRACETIDGTQIEEGYTLKAGLSHNDSGPARSRANRRASQYASGPPANRRIDFPLRISVNCEMVGAIIGRAGVTIRQITQQTRARVDIHRKDGYGDTEKIITIYGTQESCSSACEKILQVMQTESAAKEQGEIPLKILAHNNLIGRLIGKGGANIKRIMEQTNAKITVSGVYELNRNYVERIIAVRGTFEDICKAEKLIAKKLRQCYESDLSTTVPSPYTFPGMTAPVMLNEGLQMNHWIHPGSVPRGMSPPSNPFMYANHQLPYPPYQAMNQFPDPSESREEVCIFIQNNSVGAIIGTSGITIREMIHSSRANIRVEKTQPNEKLDNNSMRRITISGTPEAQWKAQYSIYKKLSLESGFDVQLKVELLIPSSQVGRIIGKGGRRIRELQQSTFTQIRVPEGFQKSEASKTPIQITGDFYGSQAAQRQLRGLIKSPTYDAPSRSPSQTAST